MALWRVLVLVLLATCVSALLEHGGSMNINKRQLKEQALEMFRHAYRSYMVRVVEYGRK